MVNTEIRLIMFFAAKDGEALYSQQKQDQEITGSDHELLIMKWTSFLGVSSKRSCRSSYNRSTSASSALLVGA